MQAINQLCIKRLHAEQKNLLKNAIDNMKVYVSSSNILEWYFCIYGLDDERYKGGQYIGLMQMDADYPYKAPKYIMYTPNGRFLPGESICTSNSEFHPENWKPIWTLDSLLRGFLSLFLEDNATGPISYNHLRTSNQEKKRLAKKSIEFNRKNYESLSKIFNDSLDVCVSRADLSAKNGIENDKINKNKEKCCEDGQDGSQDGSKQNEKDDEPKKKKISIKLKK